MDLTIFDYCILGIVGFFTLFGLLRGFISELFSLITWVGSLILVALLRQPITDLVLQKISNVILANIISSVIIFIIAIIGLSILMSNVSRKITTKFPTSINITLGIFFGFTKGFIISTLIFTTIINVFDEDFKLNEKVGPKWLQKSVVYKPLSFGTYLISPIVNPILNQIKDNYAVPAEDIEEKGIKKDLEEKIDSIRKFDFNEKESKKEEIKKEEENTGYKKEQMEKLDHLINLI